MARALLAIGLLLALGGEPPAPAPPPPVILTVPPDPAWTRCERTAQCSTTYLSCHGWIAVARAHEADVQRWYSEANADLLGVVECDGKNAAQPQAVCRDSVCKLATPPQASEGRTDG
jgi:hypothetical protein